METLWVLLFISVLFIYLNKVFGIADIIKKKAQSPLRLLRQSLNIHTAKKIF